MAKDKADNIEFDILVRAEGSGETPHVSNIDRFRPDPGDVEFCRRWLHNNGVTCYITEFGLACSASQSLFEELFSTQVKRSKQDSVRPNWQLLSDPLPPSEIVDYIEDITISVPPELF